MDLTLDSGYEDVPTSPPPGSRSQSPIDPSEIQGYLNEYQYASEPSYFTRPNRYHGPPSTWRSWTANDRIVTESLDVIRADNLSIHLYNAYDLKRRSRSAPNVRQSGAKIRSRDGGVSHNDQQVVEQEFVPPEVWTAWPLRSQYVPRGSYLHDSRIGVRSSAQTVRPSAVLEDALMATTLKHAREMWEARKSEPTRPQVRPVSHLWKSENGSGLGELKYSEGGQHNPESPRSANRNGTLDSEAGSNATDAAMMDENLPEGVQFFSSQAFAMVDDSSSEDEVPSTNSEQDYPVFSADDDSAHDIIRPSVRHILAQFDGLLDGLHKARAAYAMKGDDTNSRSRSRSVFTDAETTEDDRFIRSGSRAAVKKRGRKRKQSPHVSRSGKSQGSTSRGRSAVKVSNTKNQAYGLRDWSDVLGMATLTGWDIETVARASERCARLFGQNMTFRTFHQSSVDGRVTAHEEPWFEEEVAYATNNENAAHVPFETPSSTTRPEAWQKIDCVRTSSRCPRCRDHQIRCHAPQVTSTVDLTQPVACAACSSIPDLAPPCSGIMIRPRPKPTNKTCPYPDCARNDPAKSFTKNYHLQRHLTDVHDHINSPPTSPMVNDHRLEEYPRMTTEEHIRPTAALTCPVVSCPQNTRVFKRSTRLYDHLRKIHPEFDITSFKKIVAKHSDRGRYDRSRSRSQGRTPTRDNGNVDGSVEKDEGHVEDEVVRLEDLEKGTLRGPGGLE